MNCKINVKVFFLLFLVCTCCNSLCAQSAIPPFKKGERVVFVGNSITHGGHYHSFVWLYYMTRFPNKPITIMNAGIGGESAWDIKDRLDYDVFDRKPTYVTLTFGMNDTGYDIFWKENAKELSEQRIEKSLESFREIEKRLLAENKMTKVLIGGSPYDETTKLNSLLFLHKNDAILKIIDAQRKAAKKKNSLLIKAVEAANFPQDRFQPTTIVNTDDAIFGTGYFVVGKIEKNKRRYPWAQFIIDGNGQGRVAWRLPEQSSTILVLNKAGQIQWAKDGSLTPEEVDHVIALAQKLINE